ncbi:MAG: RDD family protein [Candidatus Latescibacteria bacterium]|nr:RDD family protein [Candidatus Latescibacterota bacterium]
MGNEVAGMGRRVVALFADLFALALLNVPLSLAFRDMTLTPLSERLIAYAAMLIYATAFVSKTGQTPGKMIMRLRVISAEGGLVTQGQALVRALVKWTPIMGILALLAALSPPPEAVQQMSGESSAPPQPGSTAAGVVSLAAIGIWLVLYAVTRRHPDRQAPHDRVAGTHVMRLP